MSKKPKCATLVRSPKGDRILMLLATNPNDVEIRALMENFRDIRRKNHPDEGELADDAVRDMIGTWIANIPKVCPDCHGKNHD